MKRKINLILCLCLAISLFASLPLEATKKQKKDYDYSKFFTDITYIIDFKTKKEYEIKTVKALLGLFDESRLRLKSYTFRTSIENQELIGHIGIDIPKNKIEYVKNKISKNKHIILIKIRKPTRKEFLNHTKLRQIEL